MPRTYRLYFFHVLIPTGYAIAFVLLLLWAFSQFRSLQYLQPDSHSFYFCTSQNAFILQNTWPVSASNGFAVKPQSRPLGPRKTDLLPYYSHVRAFAETFTNPFDFYFCTLPYWLPIALVLLPAFATHYMSIRRRTLPAFPIDSPATDKTSSK